MKKLVFFMLFCSLTLSSYNVEKVTNYKITLEDTVIPPLTKENVEKELIKRKIPHHKIVLAQSLLETGHYTSAHCKNRNNIFGMRNKKGYKYYNNWIECIDDYENKFSKRYKGGDYFVFLRKVNYAEDPSYEQKVRKLM